MKTKPYKTLKARRDPADGRELFPDPAGEFGAPCDTCGRPTVRPRHGHGRHCAGCRPRDYEGDEVPAGRCLTPHPDAARRLEELAALYGAVAAAGGESAARAAGLPASVTDLPWTEPPTERLS